MNRKVYRYQKGKTLAQAKPLDVHQQELVNIVKSAHENLAIARKVRSSELGRRMTDTKLGIQQGSERELEEATKNMASSKLRIQHEASTELEKAIHDFESEKMRIALEAEGTYARLSVRVKLDLDAEVVAHEAALDDALIAAYNNGVPIRRVALDGFGNRYEGGVQQLLVKLRNDGRLGNRSGHQRNTGESETIVSFPKPIDVAGILSESTSINQPTYTHLPVPLVLVEPDPKGDGTDGVIVPAVRLDMDLRDPWFARIQKDARPDTPFLRATFCTLYEHPATGEIVAYESKELGATLWDHPVARYVKNHKSEVAEGFRVALHDEAAEPEAAE